MRNFLPVSLFIIIWITAAISYADTLSSYDYDMEHNIISTPGSNTASIQYLKQARAYRSDGRYELAKQSYVLALSVCADNKTLSTIRRELAGVELLIRTMR